MTEFYTQMRPSSKTTAIVPKIIPSQDKVKAIQKYQNWILLACCIPMVFGAAFILLAAMPELSLVQQLWVIAPLAICLGAHLVLHRMMGNGRHSYDKKREDDHEQIH